MSPIRVAVFGAGSFGRNHARVLSQLPGVQLAGIVDTNFDRATTVAQAHNSTPFRSFADLMSAAGEPIQAAIVAVPTVFHESVAIPLIEAGVDVLIEKPIALDANAGDRLIDLAQRHNRIIQVGHLERFNPAVNSMISALSIPLFFEIHRLSVFTPRSLDVDVVLDLMIHDLDIVLRCTNEYPSTVEAAGISVLSPKVDIANVRLGFPSGCVANLTASRVSTEQIRKLRLFQPGEYLSVDYASQELTRVAVSSTEAGVQPEVKFERLSVDKAEPLLLEVDAFVNCVRDRTPPRVSAVEATLALRLAEEILDKIERHASVVHQTIRSRQRSR